MMKYRSRPYLFPITVLISAVLLANGYGDYPPRIAWSPVDEVLLASLENSLVLWEEYSGTTTVATGRTSSPAFSPDGEHAVFIMDREIYYFQVDRPGSIRPLLQAGEAASVTFDPLSDPDEPVICYTRDFLGSQIFVTTLGPSEVFVLVPEDPDARVNAPLISPDGRNLACVSFGMTPGWYEELYLYGDDAPAGRRARSSKTFEDRFDWHESNPVWLSSDLLLFQIGGWGEWELRFLSIRTGGEKVLLDNGHQPSAALDGRYLAFCRNDPFAGPGPSWEDPTTVWVMNRESGYLAQASEPGEWAREPAISPGGEYLAWIRVEGDGETLVVNESEAFISL